MEKNHNHELKNLLRQSSVLRLELEVWKARINIIMFKSKISFHTYFSAFHNTK